MSDPKKDINTWNEPNDVFRDPSIYIVILLAIMGLSSVDFTSTLVSNEFSSL